jgi:hypothetical protein
MKRGAVHEAQRFTAQLVKAAAHNAWRSVKTFCLQMPQQGMNTWRPRTSLAVNNFPDPDNGRTTAPGERYFRVSWRVADDGSSRGSLMRLVPIVRRMGIHLDRHL